MTLMTLDDIKDVLGLCARFDGRVLDEDTPKAWLMLLADIPAEDAASAVREHYRTDRRWIMPADIVAYCKQLEAERAVEQARMSPPDCWGKGCDVQYETSKLPGSLWAYPSDTHAEACNAMKGMMKFDPDRVTWGVMPQLDPQEFDEVAYEKAMAQPVPGFARYREIMGPDEDRDGGI